MTDAISRALRFDPFEGDFGEVGDRILSDKIVTAKKDHPDCHTCGGTARTGTKNRVQIAIIYGEMLTHRWCQECTEAMALVDTRLAGEDPDFDEEGEECAESPYARRVNLHRGDHD